MRITCFDSETLANLPRQPHLMVVDEIGAVSIEVSDATQFQEFSVPDALDVLERLDLASANPADVAKWLCDLTQPMGASIKTFHSTLRVLDQVVAGRTIDPSTVAWHLKNGVDVETKKRPERSNKQTLDAFNSYLKGSDAVFARGTDFDVSLLGSLCAELGVKEEFKYNSVRDIRTAADELLQDFQFSAYITADRVGKSTLGLLYPDLIPVAERITKLRKAFGHRALYDATFDLLLYVALKQKAMKEL